MILIKVRRKQCLDQWSHFGEGCVYKNEVLFKLSFYTLFYSTFPWRTSFSGSSDGTACSEGHPGSTPGQEDPLEKGMATHSSFCSWRIPWTEEPGGLLSIGSQESDWASNIFTPVENTVYLADSESSFPFPHFGTVWFREMLKIGSAGFLSLHIEWFSSR